MKKITATPRVNKYKAALDEYKTQVKEYVYSIRGRQSVEHSRTASIVTREGKTGPSSILITELLTIVRTAHKLNKLVVLGANDQELVVLLEDKVPQPPYTLY